MSLIREALKKAAEETENPVPFAFRGRERGEKDGVDAF